MKIWSLYADLEESFGTFKTTKAVYERILELKIPTPQIIINYGMFLKDHKYFEEAFKAYEKGNRKLSITYMITFILKVGLTYLIIMLLFV